MISEGTLTDTGPLFALVDAKGQPDQNARCHSLMPALAKPLVTTWPCFTEALSLCLQRGQWPMQKLLWGIWQSGALKIHSMSKPETARMAALMEQYQDRPMDTADASLIALAKTAGYTRIFSIDSDFYVYRLADGTALEVVPGPMKKGR